jgi:anthranilate phosphoribosyltransferase
MQELLAKVARGAKTSKDLTWEEAKRAAGYLIEGQASPTQVGAFLAAMRMKTESVTELAAFTAAARQYVPPLAVAPGGSLLDLPMYAGKQETFYASVIAAIVAASAGVAVLIHGAEGMVERPGPASLLAKLEIPTDQRPADVAGVLSSQGFAYLDMALYHPPIGRFLELRRELGVRTFFHQVARMLNPARAVSQVIGVSHPPYYEKTVEALRMLGTPRALVIRGVEGEPELSIASATPVLELRDERISPLMVKPKDLGVAPGTVREMAGFPAEHRAKEAELVKRIVNNEIRGGHRDWVVINAALLLYAGGKGSSIAACVPIAQQMLDSGAAAKKLKELAEASVGAASMKS